MTMTMKTLLDTTELLAKDREVMVVVLALHLLRFRTWARIKESLGLLNSKEREEEVDIIGIIRSTIAVYSMIILLWIFLWISWIMLWDKRMVFWSFWKEIQLKRHQNMRLLSKRKSKSRSSSLSLWQLPWRVEIRKLQNQPNISAMPAIPLTTTLPEEILVVPEEIDLEVAEKEVEEAMMMTMTMMMNQMRPNKRFWEKLIRSKCPWDIFWDFTSCTPFLWNLKLQGNEC